MSKIKGIIFDFGGPILKYEKWDSVLKNHVEEFGHDPDAVLKLVNSYYVSAFVGKYNSISEYCLAENITPAFDVAKLQSMMSLADRGVSIDSQMVNLIKSYKETYKLALLSNFDSSLESYLKQFGLDDMFDVVVNSSVIKVSKPHPKAYEYTLSNMALEPYETVFIDDFATNVDAAKDLGINGIVYEDFMQTKNALEKLLI
jgi:putative hydrolase of the HAD superfamily